MYIYIYIFIYLSIYLSISLSLYIYISISISISLSLSIYIYIDNHSILNYIIPYYIIPPHRPSAPQESVHQTGAVDVYV